MALHNVSWSPTSAAAFGYASPGRGSAWRSAHSMSVIESLCRSIDRTRFRKRPFNYRCIPIWRPIGSFNASGNRFGKRMFAGASPKRVFRPASSTGKVRPPDCAKPYSSLVTAVVTHDFRCGYIRLQGFQGSSSISLPRPRSFAGGVDVRCESRAGIRGRSLDQPRHPARPERVSPDQINVGGQHVATSARAPRISQ